MNEKKYKNPIIKLNEKGNTSDPYVIRYDGYYYHCFSNNEGVFVTKSKTLWDIENGQSKKVYDSMPDTALKEWFAPELHRINGKWYIYAAPDYGNFLHVMTVLVCEDESPMGEYKNLGMIRGLENVFSIDGTILTYDNGLYFVWTRCAEMYIAKMADPLSITGEIMTITKPELDFETRQGLVNEGPAVLYKNNKIHIVYSANDSRYDDYCLGLLTFEIGGNILDKSNWKKFPNAIFKAVKGIYGPGHCSFTTVTENGKERDYIVYHANLVSGTGWTGRSVFIKPFTWEGDYPVFGEPEF